jgi:hypothetical protein
MFSLSLSLFPLAPTWSVGHPWNALFHFSSLILRVGRIPCTGYQPVARPLPTAYTQNKRTDIHASSGIWTQDPSVWAREDSSCLRPRGHCDRRCVSNLLKYWWTSLVMRFVDLIRISVAVKWRDWASIQPHPNVANEWEIFYIYRNMKRSVHTMYVYSRGGPQPAPAPRPSLIYCAKRTY